VRFNQEEIMDATAQELLDFWLNEVGSEGWYGGGEALDARIRDHYLDLWQAAQDGACSEWVCAPESCLALVVLLDQFPRNMFRGDARAFASDARALAMAKSAILRGHDQRIDLPQRHFFYMPLLHSEAIANQEKGVRLVFLNLGPGGMLDQARAHRFVIRKFGRFPYRNAALGRRTTPAEEAFLAAGGYRAALAEVAA
jgi:uncharacterized protein (DUF924 family)